MTSEASLPAVPRDCFRKWFSTQMNYNGGGGALRPTEPQVPHSPLQNECRPDIINFPEFSSL